MDFIADYPRAISMFLLGGGIALIIVPKWIRWAIAVVMIALGLGELFPELLTNGA